ncbi:hypothetical protein [Pantoea eucrina]|uniref:hypothetical protein n=1 Tax=Pantoea eucrina TaxID=472693 RepID=UPI000A223407|nr:hypothetical protein [Pantoea eucrina]ORM78330.1 hypothetical protein HA43_08275 [Pantoea eucrina]
MAELKAGGLAMVFGLKENLAANGKCVRLIMMVNPGEIFKSPLSNRMLIHRESISSWICEGDIQKSHPREIGWACFNPSNLMSIDGDDFQHEDERQKELTNG